MSKSTGLYVAVAPLALLLIAGLGAHFLPILLHDKDKADEDEAPPAAYVASKHTKRHAPAPTPMPKLAARTQAEIEKTISGQIAAFRKNDFAGALTFASPEFRAMVSPSVFRDTLSRSYPQLLNSTKQTFAPAYGSSTGAMIPVSVYASDGSVTKYLYMVASQNGSWLVRGCSQLGPPLHIGGTMQQPDPMEAARL